MNQPVSGPSAVPATLLQKLVATVGNSAEYAVAIALVAVCAVVGGAAWLLTLEDDRPARKSAAAAAAPATAAGSDKLQSEEQAALAEWQEILESETEQRERRAQQSAAPAPSSPKTEPRRPPAAVASAPAPRNVPQPEETRTAAIPAALTQPKREPVRVAAGLDRNSCRPPKYPDAAVREREEGMVVMGFKLDPGGRVTDSRVELSSGSRLLDQTALNALGRCNFKPATIDGVAQAGWVQIRFNWKLD